MTCERFRFELQASTEPPEDARRHAATCPRCARQLRGALLLRLGSGGGDDGPRTGFEARVRARIAAEASAAPVSVAWADSLGRVARPALALAAIVTMTTIAIHLWDRSRGDRDDLTLLAEGDPALAALLDGNIDDIFEESLP